MSLLVLFACGLAGFMAGLLLWVLALRWLALIYITTQKQEGDFMAGSKRRLIWATPIIALLHPAPWLLAGFGYLLYRAFTAPLPEGWRWVLIAAALGLTFQALAMLMVLRISRNKLPT